MPNLTRWRLILGGDEADGTDCKLGEGDAQKDQALTALYEFERKKKFDYQPKSQQGGSEKSSPSVARWLGDIRNYFPQSVVQVMQSDAIKHPELQRKLMLEPEVLAEATPDVHLVASLMELGNLIPSKTKDTARRVVQQVVEDLMAKLTQKTVQAITGALNRRLEHHHSQKSKTLPSRLQNHHSRSPHRLRTQNQTLPQRHRTLPRPKRLNGCIRRLFRHIWRSHGIITQYKNQNGRL
jgi:hypothetical protein